MASNAEYLLLFRGAHWDRDLSPAQIQEVMGRWSAWLEDLRADGRALAAQPLLREGKVVSGRDGECVKDGPFAESKESVGGFFKVAVAGLDEALAIARECPALEYGMTVEVRQVTECSIAMQRNAAAATG